MAYAGAGLLWTVSGGVPRALRLAPGAAIAATQDFSFVQISDTHIGFKNEPNPDPAATLREALQRIAALPARPAFLVHTGDVTHLAKPAEFDAAQQIMATAGLEIHYVPGEHDTLNDDGKSFFERFGRDSRSGGWYSFDQGGVHFVGLVNVVNLRAGGLGYLGPEQLQWLKDDLQGRGASTPIVVMAHMPLWSLYPEWGWGTDDAAEALGYMKRFGSVTVLNGHIHQVMQKVEGNVSFQTARSTAFPQPAPGEAKGPGPLKVPADRLRSVLGIRRVEIVPEHAAPSISDQALGA
jgi:3',5'-cyclic AMP phosphodiesterase CpdA